jgi:glycosyltransferase involved in cell wall biosynthesis
MSTASPNGSESLPLVSVVTPVHNTAAYLDECIRSVRAQTYPRLEYVISDNRSDDGSLEIARRHEAEDPRIRVVAHEEFVTAMQSLNRSLRAISSECAWVKMVCADDWLFPECVERMAALASGHPSVGVVGAYRLDEDRVDLDGIPVDRPVLEGHEIIRWSLLGFPYVFGSPTSTMVRGDLVRARRPFYEESRPHADTEVCYELLEECDLGFVHQVLTFTRRHNESQVSRLRRLDSFTASQADLLRRYGPRHLTPGEYERRVAALTAAYVGRLGRAPLRLRNPEYRRLHGRALGGLARDVRPAGVARGVARRLRGRRGPAAEVRA